MIKGALNPAPRHRIATLVRLVLLSFALFILGILTESRPVARALDNGLALSPYMGWNSYYGWTPLNEQSILDVADAMVGRGLLAAGYQYVWLDVTWWDGGRDASGNIVAPEWQWPHGLRYLTDQLHSRGLKAGIYTDAGADGCGGSNQGSGPSQAGGSDHYQQDADQFAVWGFDAVKVDFCGGKTAGLDPATQYLAFSAALLNNSSQRSLIFNICNPFSSYNENPPLQQSAYWSYTFGPASANSWRTETDAGLPHGNSSFQWRDVLRNLVSDSAHPEAAGPGHWNDPDYLGPENGMTAVEDRAQFSMWAMLAAPLMIGSDVRALSDDAVGMLTNPDVIAIDQDPLGWQGVKIVDYGGPQVWMRYLAVPGTRAVALFNTTAAEKVIPVYWSSLGLKGRAGVRDLWSRTDLGEFDQGYAASVPSHGAVLVLVSGTNK